MKDRLEEQIKEYIRHHKEHSRFSIAAVILSVCTAFCVIASLVNPASALTGDSISISADSDTAENGTEINLNVSATSGSDSTYYVMSYDAGNAGLSSAYQLDDQGAFTVTTQSGTSITLTSASSEDGTAYVWFELQAGDSEQFTLSCAAEDSSSQGILDWYSASGSSIDEALNALPDAPTASMNWTVSETDTGEASDEGIMTVDYNASTDEITADDKTKAGDLTSHITAATVQIDNGSSLGSATSTVTDGDKVKISYSFNFSDGVTSDARTFKYVIPSNIVLTEDKTNVTVYDSTTGQAIGTLNIYKATDSSDAVAYIKFYNSYADSQSFSGSFYYEGTASLKGSNDSKEVELGGSGGSITINPKATDISVYKSASTDSTTPSQINYSVTASTTNGTGGTVSFTDAFSSDTGLLSATYNTGSFTVKKIGNNSSTDVDLPTGQPVISNDGKSFTLSGLPALSAGEKYVLSYSATASKATVGSSVKNTATATSKGKTDTKTVTTQIYHPSITNKTGTYDQSSKTISWTITVDANGTDLSGYVIDDPLSKGADGKEVAGVSLSGEITISDGKHSTTTTKFPYTFPATDSEWGELSHTGTYTITYKTTVPTDINITSVTNPATLINDETEVSNKDGVATLVHTPTDDKKFDSETDVEGNNDLKKYNWKSTITVPDDVGMLKDSTITYNDYITTGDTSYYTSHYATKSDLEASIAESLKSYVDDGDISYVLTCYDSVNWNRNVVTDGNTKVYSFQLNITALKNIPLDTTFTLNYYTYADYSNMEDGATRTFINTGNNKQASHSHSKTTDFVKQVNTSGDGLHAYYMSPNFTSSSTTLTYGNNSGRLYYRVLFSLENETGGDITLTDTIPQGTTWATENGNYKIAGYLCEDVTGQTWSNNNNSYDLTGTYKPTVTLNEDSTYTITVKDGYQNADKKYKYFALVYELDTTSDTFWNSLKNSDKQYENSITWNSKTETQTTTVHRETPSLEKTGTQSTDAGNNILNSADYAVVVNKGGKDLDPDSATLTLTDTLAISNIPSGVTVSLVMDDVHVYNYDASASNHIGTEISTERYQFTYDQSTGKITFTLPDETPCVVTYRYQLDRGSNTQTITLGNSAELTGVANSSTSKSTSLVNATAGAVTVKPSITILKVDADNYKTVLADAHFTIQQYDNTLETPAWTDVTSSVSDGTLSSGEYITGTDGKISFTASGSLVQNRVYRIKETSAPEGYSAFSGYKYFVWMKENTSKADTITVMNKANAYDSLTDDEKNLIQYIAYSGGTVYVPNTDTRLTVKKIWIDSNGNEFTGSGTVPITVTLYQQSFNDDNTAASDKTIAKDTDGKDIKVTLSDANNWQYTWNSLPQTDSNNKKILYSVVEDPVSDYSVSYSASEIQTGMITITNKSSFSLPSTGGIGNTPYYLMGIMLMAVSLIFYLRKKTGSGGCG